MARAVPHVGVAALALVGLLLGIAAAPVFVLTLLPVIAILLPLVLGVMPGERTLERLRTRREPPRRRRPSTIVRAPRLAILVRRTGRLIASALAMRPPPARPSVVS